MKSTLRSSLKRPSDTDGSAAVEFAIILMVFLAIVMGILEFGYDWYLRNALANASREGCRWGVMYRQDAAGGVLNPCDLPSGSTIQDVVTNYLTPMLPSGTNWNTSVTGAGYTAEFDASGTLANPLTVTVTATKTWSALGSLIPGLDMNNMTITVATTMRRE